MSKINLGSVSHGTLRPEDLVSSFCDVLRTQRGYRRLAREGAKLLQSGESEQLSDFLEERLFPAMEELAPPYAYFSAHEGDGSDFGYWADIDSLEEAAREGDTVVKAAAGASWPDDLPRSVRFVMEVNDHGNVTLFYRANRRIVWDVV